MCGHGKHHHCECDCHEGKHSGHHEGCECNCHKERECECGHDEGGCEKHRASRECECDCHADSESTRAHFERRFKTRAERITELEAYLRDLQTEAKAVEERIAEMKAISA
jgi:hypothetical protein